MQCKTARRVRKNSITFNVASTYGHRQKPRQSYEGQVDYFGVYCPEIDKAYLIPFSVVAGLTSEAALRLDAGTSGQVKNARFAQQFELR